MATTGFGSLNPARVTPAKEGIHGRFRVADVASRLRRPLSRTAPPGAVGQEPRHRQAGQGDESLHVSG